jgi:hypothetical protein
VVAVEAALATFKNGNTIVTNVGFPFTVTGGPGKCAVFNGDIDVTGVIDPKGITFTRETVDPLGAQDGIWVNSLGELNIKQAGVGTTNVTTALAGAVSSEATSVNLTNNTGFTVNAGTPICLDSNGEMKFVDVSSETDAESFVGLAAETVLNGASGKVIVTGKLLSVTTTALFGEGLWVSKTGGLTNVGPSIGVGGFIVGDWVIKIGMVSKNLSNPLNKDIILNSVNRGQL